MNIYLPMDKWQDLSHHLCTTLSASIVYFVPLCLRHTKYEKRHFDLSDPVTCLHRYMQNGNFITRQLLYFWASRSLPNMFVLANRLVPVSTQFCAAFHFLEFFKHRCRKQISTVHASLWIKTKMGPIILIVQTVKNSFLLCFYYVILML